MAGPRIAYWYATDTPVQFRYRRLRIAEYHLLHWNSAIAVRRDIAFVSLTALPKRSRFAPPPLLSPPRVGPCSHRLARPNERGRVSMTSILFFQPPNPFRDPIIDRQFNGRLKIGPRCYVATLFQHFSRVCGGPMLWANTCYIKWYGNNK